MPERNPDEMDQATDPIDLALGNGRDTVFNRIPGPTSIPGYRVRKREENGRAGP